MLGFSRVAGRRGPVGVRIALLFAAGLIVAPAVVACNADTHAGSGGTATSMPGMQSPATPNAQQIAWAARPGYVRDNPRTQTAYEIAMQMPQILQWIPCYCGCGAMGHGSNLDCYFKPTTDGGASIQFEEHASFCGICVDETLMTKQLLDQGKSLRDIRTTIDQTFGGSGPGTPTEFPPA